MAVGTVIYNQCCFLGPGDLACSGSWIDLQGFNLVQSVVLTINSIVAIPPTSDLTSWQVTLPCDIINKNYRMCIILIIGTEKENFHHTMQINFKLITSIKLLHRENLKVL